MFRQSLLHCARQFKALLALKWNDHKARKKRHAGYGAICLATALASSQWQWRVWWLPVLGASSDDKGDKSNKSDKSDKIVRQRGPLDKLMLYIYKHWLKGASPKKKKKSSLTASRTVSCLKDSDTEGPAEVKQVKGHRDTFRDKTIRSYESRLRMYSNPEKLFKYFATIRTKNDAGRYEVFMTPADFLRSIAPGRKQPEGLGLDQYRKIRPGVDEVPHCSDLDPNSVFYKFRADGLLAFGDYLFILLLMSMPERYFQIGFKMFDLGGDGNLGIEDMQFMADSLTYGDVALNNLSINRYFFGPQLNQKLSIQKFVKFQQQLNDEILMLEFKTHVKGAKKELGENIISELAFAKVMLAYAQLPPAEINTTLKRIKKKYRDGSGITFKEYMTFFKFVMDLPAIDVALTFHYLSGAHISRDTLKHVAHVVLGVNLSDHLIDVIYSVFDTDNNGILSRKEFISALRSRLDRGKTKGKINVLEFFGVLFKCSVDRIL